MVLGAALSEEFQLPCLSAQYQNPADLIKPQTGVGCISLPASLSLQQMLVALSFIRCCEDPQSTATLIFKKLK